MVAMHTLRGRISSKLKVDTHTEGLPGDRHLEAIWGGGGGGWRKEGGRLQGEGGRVGEFGCVWSVGTEWVSWNVGGMVSWQPVEGDS